MHSFIYLIFSSYSPLRGREIKLCPCLWGAAQCLAADINKRSIRNKKKDYCMRLACQIPSPRGISAPSCHSGMTDWHEWPIVQCPNGKQENKRVQYWHCVPSLSSVGKSGSEELGIFLSHPGLHRLVFMMEIHNGCSWLEAHFGVISSENRNAILKWFVQYTLRLFCYRQTELVILRCALKTPDCL